MAPTDSERPDAPDLTAGDASGRGSLFSPAPKAVLFDIDGTLVDSNYLHVDAWSRAFEQVGHPVDTWRIHRSIGLDSDRLIEDLLGDDRGSAGGDHGEGSGEGSDAGAGSDASEGDDLGDRAKQLHTDIYAEMNDRLRPLPGAVELLRALHEAGVRVVLATSAPKNELDVLTGVLDCDDAIHATTSSDDVDTAKPEPDIVNIALERAGVTAAEALFVGDAVWDMKAAGRAGVRSIGVRTGGFGADELIEAGAIDVFDDAAAVLRAFRGASR
ncbi:HAD family hydrolase [Agreia sp. COWG]|uniref:HAD family hydrolase n=1 Tax=Agreia sp. COWG TaxID=2773266 RepID=UPI001928AB01|nr:HAD family hydrolase [Agreia sp. COWG]CAD6007003.1 HAD family hydrolase [Agreia sp. COWG]